MIMICAILEIEENKSVYHCAFTIFFCLGGVQLVDQTQTIINFKKSWTRIIYITLELNSGSSHGGFAGVNIC